MQSHQKMNVLDSPIQALAFSPFNLGPLLSTAINNLWAWVALIAAAAALSYWSFHHSIFNPRSPGLETTLSPFSNCSTPKLKTTSSPFSTDSSKSSIKKEEVEEEGGLTRGESFKQRFTAYYEEERENVQEEDEVEGGDDDPALRKRWRLDSVSGSGSGSGWGWYGYQDRRVIDGSVVRLWEETQKSSIPPSLVGVSHNSPFIFSETQYYHV